MTENLKNLMHERAAQPDFALPDLDALVRDGDRLVRRRRTALVGGLAALAVVGSLGVAQLLGGMSPASAPVPVTDAPTSTAAEVSWATGSVIHTPDATIEVGHEIAAYVRLSTGYATVDPSGVVRSVQGDRVSDIGQIAGNSRRLVADEQGSLVGWVDVLGDSPRFLVYDQATHSFTGDEAPGADRNGTAEFYAIDDSTAYWRAADGVVSFELDTGAVEVIEADPRGEFAIRDVQNGLRAFWGREGMRVGTTPDESLELTGAFGDMGVLSPDGRWFSQDEDDPMVFDTATGDRVTFDLPDYGFATGYEWLDAHTLVMLAAQDPGTSSAELLTCQVPAGSCTVAQPDLGTFDELSGNLQLPIGENISGD